MAKELNVRVELAARCLINGCIRESGEVVELPEAVAKSFGKVLTGKQAEPKAEPKPETPATDGD